MQDLNDLYFFARVVQDGGFAAAGRALGIPKSRLSRRIAQLESRLGVRLLHRSTRRLALTEVGQTCYEHCQAMIAGAQAAQESIERVQAEPRGTLRVSCPINIAQNLMAPVLPRFLIAHPHVQVHMEVTNRAVDPIEEGFDLAIRVRPVIEDSSLVARSFGSSPGALMAAPRLLDQAGRPESPEALQRLPSLAMSPQDGRHAWPLVAPDGELRLVSHSPRLVADDLSVLKEAAVAGIGVAALPLFVCCDELRGGLLEQVLPHWPVPPGKLHAVFPSRRGLVPAVRLFIDFLAAELPPISEARGLLGSRSEPGPAHRPPAGLAPSG